MAMSASSKELLWSQCRAAKSTHIIVVRIDRRGLDADADIRDLVDREIGAVVRKIPAPPDGITYFVLGLVVDSAVTRSVAYNVGIAVTTRIFPAAKIILFLNSALAPCPGMLSAFFEGAVDRLTTYAQDTVPAVYRGRPRADILAAAFPMATLLALGGFARLTHHSPVELKLALIAADKLDDAGYDQCDVDATIPPGRKTEWMARQDEVPSDAENAEYVAACAAAQGGLKDTAFVTRFSVIDDRNRLLALSIELRPNGTPLTLVPPYKFV